MVNNLVSVFQDTQRQIWENQKLHELTSQAIMCTRVFPENFSITRVMTYNQTLLSVVESGTLTAAKTLAVRYPRVAVLNFANAVNPGGGVMYGAQAQEESICRCTNLYPCLMKPEVFDAFYSYNNEKDRYYSDRLIYSEKVTVFKSDEDESKNLEQWFQIDVITCPAPNLNGASTVDFQKLEKTFVSRIRNILTVAEMYGVQALVLGAFGCGAFSNPPDLVAKVFRELLVEGEFQNIFREVVFAIKGQCIRDWNNLEIFKSVLNPVRDNTLYGKRISILGDSISTFAGSNPDYCNVFYDENRKMQAGIYTIEDTWWAQVARWFGAEILVNNSYSGSRVSGSGQFAGNSDLRIHDLGCGMTLPDAILIYMGINDYGNGIPLNIEDGYIIENAQKCFRQSYELMLWKVKRTYPNTEVYCATLCPAGIGGQDIFPYNIYGIPFDAYNEVIRESAEKYGFSAVDLRAQGICYDSIDGTHPSALGMRQLAEGWIHALGTPADFEKEEDKSKSYALPIIYGSAAGLILIVILISVILIL